MEYSWNCKSVARYHEHRTLNSDVWQWRATVGITGSCGLLVERTVDLLLHRAVANILCNIWLLHRYTCGRLHLKCDGTRVETGFRLSAKRMSPFKSAGDVSSVDYWQSRCTHQR